MIIECVNCNKKFNVDSELIPSHGRQIQCGSCKYTWHYKIKDASSEPLILDNIEIPTELKKFDNQEIIESDNLIDNKKSTIIEKKTEIKDKKIENRSVGNFFSFLLVIIISFITLLILVDTFKSPLINIFPKLEIILFNLFETFKDVKLFINDLT